MVHVLSLILLTAGGELRMLLKQAPTTGTGTARRAPALHNSIPRVGFVSSPCSPCACSMPRAEAFDLVLQFGALEMSVKFLVQIDRLGNSSNRPSSRT